MPNDMYGRPVSVGDEVSFTGTVESMTEEHDYINCTVLLDQLMPPSGAQVKLQCNTAQFVDNSSGGVGKQQQSVEPAAGRRRRDE